MIITFPLFLFLCSCKNRNIEIIYYDDTKIIKEKKIFFYENDTSNYEYTSYYLNGLIRNQGVVCDSKKDGLWNEWYGDGVLRRELYYIAGELDYENEKRKLPEVIFESDSLFFEVENKMKYLNFYPDETFTFAGLMVWSLRNDSCYDFGIMPVTMDSAYIIYFSRNQFSSIDTIYLKDVATAEEISLSNEGFEWLKKVNPDYYTVRRVRKMIIVMQEKVYQK